MVHIRQRIRVRVLKTSDKNPTKQCPTCKGTGRVRNK